VRPSTWRLQQTELLAVFGFAAFLVYSWSIVISFYELPSWLHYLSLTQLAAIYGYMFIVDFAECLLLLVATQAAELLLFRPLLGSPGSVARSVILIGVFLGTAMLRLVRFEYFSELEMFVQSEVGWWAVAVVVAGTALTVVHRAEPIRRLLEGLADRTAVLLIAYLPLTAIGGIIVMARSLA